VKPLIAGGNADPEGDGIANWLEWALGLNLNQRDVSKLPTAALQTTGGNTYLTMKYRQLIGQPVLDYNVGVSGDLQAWDGTESQIAQPGPPVATGEGLTEEVTVRVASPINGTAQKFLTLRVNQLPWNCSGIHLLHLVSKVDIQPLGARKAFKLLTVARPEAEQV